MYVLLCNKQLGIYNIPSKLNNMLVVVQEAGVEGDGEHGHALQAAELLAQVVRHHRHVAHHRAVQREGHLDTFAYSFIN